MQPRFHSCPNLNLYMPAFLFWTFAALMLGLRRRRRVNRNPVASALSLVVSFLGLAALFMGLDAFFIGIIQVLVYAGAVMVLFLFIIMLLDLRAEERRKINCRRRRSAGRRSRSRSSCRSALVIGKLRRRQTHFPRSPGATR